MALFITQPWQQQLNDNFKHDFTGVTYILIEKRKARCFISHIKQLQKKISTTRVQSGFFFQLDRIEKFRKPRRHVSLVEKEPLFSLVVLVTFNINVN